MFICQVTLSNGSARRMDQISVGDWVKSPLDGFFGLMDTPVETWLHRLPEKESEFVVCVSYFLVWKELKSLG